MTDLRDELFAYLRRNAPGTYYTGGYALEPRRWVLTKDTLRELCALQGDPEPDDDWSGGMLMTLPVRVDGSVDRFALETIE